MTQEERDAIVEAALIRDDAHDVLADGAREVEESAYRCRHYISVVECSRCIRAQARGKLFLKIGFWLVGAAIALYIALFALSKAFGA